MKDYAQLKHEWWSHDWSHILILGAEICKIYKKLKFKAELFWKYSNNKLN